MKFTSLLLSLLFVIGSFFQNLAYFFTPTIEFDAASPQGEITHGACGFLYGLAQSGVPSKEMVKSLEITSASQKVIGGLQHPIGDVDNVAENLTGADYIVVYLQDCFSTWYYAWDEIDALRKSGEYDCVSFVDQRFLPQVRESVTALSQKDYSGRVVYCLYNECDNPVWFGTETDEGWLSFDDAAKARFYAAWKKTFELVRSIDPHALIGGPGYCDYENYKISDFLSYCKQNSCLPDVMIYHELNSGSSKYWTEHTDDYRQTEKALGIKELPVIVTEYGTMEECGAPSAMLRYLSAIESSGTYGNIAYWRLADNLCDTCAKANLPNSEWWLFKWYSDMSGGALRANVLDLLHSDVANAIKYRRAKYYKSELGGLGSLNEDEGKIDIICGGENYDFQVAVKGVSRALGRKVGVKVEAVTYEGLSGEVCAPVTIEQYSASALGTLKIKMNGTDKNAVYHIQISKDIPQNAACGTLPARFEFEDGTLLGAAYTYDSAYATTGAQSGMCGGFEKEGDGITLDFAVPESGDYTLFLIYGKCNDGPSPESRVSAEVNFDLDGERSVIRLPNTIKSEYTDKFAIDAFLEAGAHSVTLAHGSGTFVLDSLLVEKQSEKEIYTEYIKKYGELLVIAPRDGYYTVNSAEHYLKRGLNYIPAPEGESCTAVYTPKDDYFTALPSDAILSDGAEIRSENGAEFIDGIGSGGGCATVKVNAENAGRYALTLTYSNNEEKGVHAYNVDLIEEYVTVTVNGESLELWCTNTYSFENYNTAVAYITLAQGENEITLSNDGSCRFNSFESNAPRIARITVNPA